MNDKRRSGTTGAAEPSIDADGHWRQVAQRPFDPAAGESLTVVVVSTIADAMGVEPIEVQSPPLFDVVDIAALEDAYFANGKTTEGRDSTGSATFKYNDYLVAVRSDGWVQVSEPGQTQAE
jgi:hypothetical protein